MIAAGGNHTCAVLANSSLACWGNNDRGQLGTGTSDHASIPSIAIAHPSSGIMSICAGADFTCLLAIDGSIACWGSNDHG